MNELFNTINDICDKILTQYGDSQLVDEIKKTINNKIKSPNTINQLL